MKKLFFLLIPAILFYSCSGNCTSETCGKNKKGAENIALIEKYISAVEAGDYATIESMIADNYVGFGPSIDDTTNREDGLASWKYNLENLYEFITYDHKRFLSQTLTDGDYPGEWVSSWGFATIKYKDGRGPVRLFTNTLYKIENGKIAISLTVYNENDVLEQLGMK